MVGSRHRLQHACCPVRCPGRASNRPAYGAQDPLIQTAFTDLARVVTDNAFPDAATRQAHKPRCALVPGSQATVALCMADLAEGEPAGRLRDRIVHALKWMNPYEGQDAEEAHNLRRMRTAAEAPS